MGTIRTESFPLLFLAPPPAASGQERIASNQMKANFSSPAPAKGFKISLYAVRISSMFF